jgi:hypothetical protein
MMPSDRNSGLPRLGLGPWRFAAAAGLVLVLVGAAAQWAPATGWALNGAVDLPARSFVMIRDGVWKTPSGETRARYRGRVTLAPRFWLSGGETLLVDLGTDRVQLEALEQTSPAEPGATPWQKELAQLQAPYQRVERVRAVFDRGWSEAAGGETTLRELTVPPAATRLVRLELEWQWGEEQHTAYFGTAGEGRPDLALGVLAAAAGCLAAGGAAVQTRRGRDGEA